MNELARPRAPDESALRQRIETFLGEFRMIIPALAALLGFQLMAALQESFRGLDLAERTANFVGLACTATALLFLLVPASYHRFTTRIEESVDFLEFAQRNVGFAFILMPFGICFSLYVQAFRTFGSRPLALAIAAVLFGAYAVGWWVLPRRRAHRRAAQLDAQERDEEAAAAIRQPTLSRGPPPSA